MEAWKTSINNPWKWQKKLADHRSFSLNFQLYYRAHLPEKTLIILYWLLDSYCASVAMEVTGLPNVPPTQSLFLYNMCR